MYLDYNTDQHQVKLIVKKVGIKFGEYVIIF